MEFFSKRYWALQHAMTELNSRPILALITTCEGEIAMKEPKSQV
jgi:hypothetical protein